MKLTCLLLLPAAALAAPVDFVREVQPIFAQHCHDCHGEKKQKSGLRLDIKSEALKGGDNHGPDILPGRAKDSPLIHFVTTDDEDELMPPAGRLSAAEIATLTRWIEEGAAWPDGIDTAQLEDRTDHWSFRPLQADLKSQISNLRSIDAFVDAKLAEQGLHRAPPADPATLIRRLSLDLTGLPPPPEEVAAFVKECDGDQANEAALERLVDRLLASPHHGERWAQHWLDVVRYADTHGFEVNTERPNAWPYRDYVIQALNADLPYDQFIRHQIAGDAPSAISHLPSSLHPDAATGFLVTASVLLPGQIGKDAPSMRLARQDSIDEIVVNIGQTFLGLSLGCARCHDHKFDPVSAREYYAMQAFVAGVEYADRPLRSPEAMARERETAKLKQQGIDLDRRLMRFVPLARPGSPARVTNPTRNEQVFKPAEARFVRFTIHDANLHPKLGLLEPCLDEFEIFSAGVNLAPQAKVRASGSRTSAKHRLEHLNDGRHGNDRSWMSDVKGRGWVEFELPEARRIDRIVWSRDREGRFQDRLATAFTLEAGLERDALRVLAEARPPRPTVHWKLSTDRFTPVQARRLRFTVLATNGLSPCLDEVEVFDTRGRNVARGAKVKTSGNILVPDRHDPAYVNDGVYGNSRSWLGNEEGRGWVELEFADAVQIDRVVWSRDREGRLEDRMTTDYRIETALQDGAWQLVADASDRRPFVAGTALDPVFSAAGLPPEEARQAEALLAEKRALEARIQAAEQGQLVFAGKFRTPDEIRLLNRGDPEQPKEAVAPAVPAALGKLTLAANTPEPARRQALAEWIASPANPLTARVMVNRVWQGHFGTGLVETPSDFGRSGMKPSHPELLDWLAAEFIRDGWSLKKLHRLIVLSQAYRQSGFGLSQKGAAQAAAALDADNRLLWRFPTRRLEAEALRDTMLAVSGRLNPAMFGRGYDLFDKRGGLSGFKPVEVFTPVNERRMIYAHKVRRESEAVFGAFDCPDAGQSTARRVQSTTPIQALNLFNSRFTLAQAEALAKRLQREAGADPKRQIERAYQLALGRVPSPEEMDEAEPIVRTHGVAVLARALFNSSEFLFLP